jgi:hypothetical protein
LLKILEWLGSRLDAYASKKEFSDDASDPNDLAWIVFQFYFLQAALIVKYFRGRKSETSQTKIKNPKKNKEQRSFNECTSKK